MDLVCLNCGAKSYCIEACDPGSVVCLANRLRTGRTKTDVLSHEAVPANPQYCAYCGKPLKVWKQTGDGLSYSMTGIGGPYTATAEGWETHAV